MSIRGFSEIDGHRGSLVNRLVCRRKKPTMNLTQKYVEKLQATDQRQTFRDDQIGFGVRVEAKALGGRKSYFYNAKIGGRIVFKSLGDVASLSVKDAREKARALGAKALEWKQAGFPLVLKDNPFARQPHTASEGSTAPLFQEMLDTYIEFHIKKTANKPAKAEADLRWLIKKHCPELAAKRIDEIAVEDIATIKKNLATTPFLANRTIQMLKAIYSWASSKHDGKVNFYPVANNPATEVEIYDCEEPRDRYLTAEERVLLEEGLDDPRTPRDLADFVLLALDTGARKDNLLSMEWTEIDWDRMQWKIPKGKTKNQVGYTVDLVNKAPEILERRHSERTTSRFVFPAVSAARGYIHFDKPWQSLVRRIGGTLVSNPVRIHDLRRSCASALASARVSPQQIAKALGHSDSNMRAVLTYAKLFPEDMPTAREAGANKMNELMVAAKERMKRQQQPIVMKERKRAGGEK